MFEFHKFTAMKPPHPYSKFFLKSMIGEFDENEKS